MVFIKVLLILVPLAFLAFRLFRAISAADRGEKVAYQPLVVGGGAVAVFVFLILPAFGQVPAGHRGVVLQFGAVTGEIKKEGFYVVTPFVQSIALMDVQVQASPLQALAASKDLQDVSTTVTPNWHLDPARVAQIYQSMRYEYGPRVIQPAVQEAVKATTAKYNAEELITHRAEVRDAISQMLATRFNEFGITLDAMSITNFAFSEAFSHAIEAKVTATQQALKAENDLRRIKVEAEQRIAQATAEAEAIRIQAESISKQGGVAYVNLKAIEKWNGELPQWMGSSQPVPFVNVK